MIEFKKGSAARIPVRLVDSTTGASLAGVAVGSITAAIEKSDGTVAALSLSGANWVEITTGTFAGSGRYTLVLPTSATDTHGILNVAVKSSASAHFLGSFKVVSAEGADIMKYHEGRWKIAVSGADANRLVIYDTDGTTVLKKFDLKDANGNSTPYNPFEKLPL